MAGNGHFRANPLVLARRRGRDKIPTLRASLCRAAHPRFQVPDGQFHAREHVPRGILDSPRDRAVVCAHALTQNHNPVETINLAAPIIASRLSFPEYRHGARCGFQRVATDPIQQGRSHRKSSPEPCRPSSRTTSERIPCEAHVKDDQFHKASRVHQEPQLARVAPAHPLGMRSNHRSTQLARHRNQQDEKEIEIGACPNLKTRLVRIPVSTKEKRDQQQGVTASSLSINCCRNFRGVTRPAVKPPTRA